MPATVSTVELTWTTVAIYGVLLSLFDLRDAIGDQRVLRKAGTNGIKRMIARAGVENASGRLLVQCIYLVAGLLAAAAPPHLPRSPVADVLAWLLVIGAAVLLALTLRARHIRRQMLHYHQQRAKMYEVSP